jgi:hypothetical protein
VRCVEQNVEDISNNNSKRDVSGKVRSFRTVKGLNVILGPVEYVLLVPVELGRGGDTKYVLLSS